MRGTEMSDLHPYARLKEENAALNAENARLVRILRDSDLQILRTENRELRAENRELRTKSTVYRKGREYFSALYETQLAENEDLRAGGKS